jgi:hypothetical protein
MYSGQTWHIPTFRDRDSSLEHTPFPKRPSYPVYFRGGKNKMKCREKTRTGLSRRPSAGGLNKACAETTKMSEYPSHSVLGSSKLFAIR